MKTPRKTKPQRLRFFAIILFTASFITPDFESRNFGFNAFLATPQEAIGSLGKR